MVAGGSVASHLFSFLFRVLRLGSGVPSLSATHLALPRGEVRNAWLSVGFGMSSERAIEAARKSSTRSDQLASLGLHAGTHSFSMHLLARGMLDNMLEV